jgi:hypothetical protein
MKILLIIFTFFFLTSSTPYHPALDTALKYANTHEIGNNAGFDNKWLEKRLKAEGWKIPEPYCSWFTSFCLDAGKAKTPTYRGGLAIRFYDKTSIPAKKVLLGQVKIDAGYICTFQHDNTIFGHSSQVISWNKESGVTIEANTSPTNTGNQSNGDGIYIKHRKIEPRNHFRIKGFTKVTY